MIAVAFGFHAFNRIHHILAFHHFAKHGIAPAVHARIGVVQKVVVFGVDEKLRRSRMRRLGARHRHGVFIVFQAVLRFVLNRLAGGFFVHVFIHAAALNHKAFDNAVENHAVVKAVFHILLEVGRGKGRFFMVELDADGAEIGVQFNHINNPCWVGLNLLIDGEAAQNIQGRLKRFFCMLSDGLCLLLQ